MKRFIVGIAPGQKGCIAIIRDGVLEVHDLKGCYKATGCTTQFPEKYAKIRHLKCQKTVPY